MYFVSACGKFNLLLFKILKKAISKKLSQLNHNLRKYLGSTNIIGNRTCRKREMQVLWHFVASWESPDAAERRGMWVLLWLIDFRHAYPCVIGMRWPQLWTWERQCSLQVSCHLTSELHRNLSLLTLIISSNWWFKKILFSSKHCDIKAFLQSVPNLCDSGTVHGVTYRWVGFALKGKMVDSSVCH